MKKAENEPKGLTSVGISWDIGKYVKSFANPYKQKPFLKELLHI